MNALEETERQLLAAVAARHATSDPASVPASEFKDAAKPRRPRWVRRRGRGSRIVILLIALALLGGAATAATLLIGQHSAPLSGQVPRGQQPGYAVAGGYRYQISLSPALQTGQIGWCAAVKTFARSGAPEDLGTGDCEDAPTSGSPLFDAQVGEGLSFVFTTSTIRAIRVPGNGTILTLTDGQLPFGYRAAVFEDQLPSTSAADLTPIDATGKAILPDRSGMPIEPVKTWGHAAEPAKGSCALSAKPHARLSFGVGSVLTAIFPAPAIVGGGFLPCIERNVRLDSTSATSFPISERVMQAFILLNAKDPRAAAPQLPNLHELPDHSGVLDNPTLAVPDTLSNGMTAKRVNHAWLVVVGGHNTNERLAALDGLETGPVILQATRAFSTHHATSCTINYRPSNGLVKTSQNSGHNGDCASASFYYRQRWPLTARAIRTSQCQNPPPILPGLCPQNRPDPQTTAIKPVPGHRNEYTVALRGGRSITTVQHHKRAWLIVLGGKNAAQQQTLINRLSIAVNTNS